MKLVIDIPEEKYQGIVNMAEEILDTSTFCSPRYLYKAVLNGTPLPKGHGRLIDADELKETFIEPNIYIKTNEKGFWCVTSKEIRNAQTIIEADKDGDAE